MVAGVLLAGSLTALAAADRASCWVYVKVKLSDAATTTSIPAATIHVFDKKTESIVATLDEVSAGIYAKDFEVEATDCDEGLRKKKEDLRLKIEPCGGELEGCRRAGPDPCCSHLSDSEHLDAYREIPLKPTWPASCGSLIPDAHKIVVGFRNSEEVTETLEQLKLDLSGLHLTCPWDNASDVRTPVSTGVQQSSGGSCIKVDFVQCGDSWLIEDAERHPQTITEKMKADALVFGQVDDREVPSRIQARVTREDVWVCRDECTGFLETTDRGAANIRASVLAAIAAELRSTEDWVDCVAVIGLAQDNLGSVQGPLSAYIERIATECKANQPPSALLPNPEEIRGPS